MNLKKRPPSAIVVPLAFLVMTTCTSGLIASAGKPVPSTSTSKNNAPKPQKVVERTLHFPEQSFGGLYVVPKGNWGQLYGEPEIAVAKDTVKLKVPAGSEVLLRANTALLQNPSELDKWTPDGIECLELRSALFSLSDEQFGTKVLSHVSKLTGLRILRATALEPDDIGISVLKSLKKLEMLSINVGKLDGSCLKDLQTLPALQELDISDNPINLNNLSYIQNYPVLRHLELHRCKLNKGAIQQLAKSATLSDLNLSGNPGVRDDCCEYLGKMPSLNILDLTGTQITAHGLMKMQGAKKLRYIAISSSFVAPDAVSDVKKALPDTKLVLKSTALTPTKDTSRIFAPLPK